MLFNSYIFIFVYLPIVVIGYYQLSRVDNYFSAAWVAFASIFFYGYWNPAYIGLLLASIVFNYSSGVWIARAKNYNLNSRAKYLLVISITSNLALLCYYKYTNFFLDSSNSLFGTHWSFGNIILPLGISFFTFTQIAFLVDTYKEEVKEYNFIHYLLFVTYFPHLIAGPIIHHKEMMPQFDRASTYSINWDNFASGILLFTAGLVKKVMIADFFANYANGVFNSVNHGAMLTIYEAWAGALAYTMQIYFDFSGYTDMALGIALIFNIKLPINFNSPYKSTSIIEFWRRWHITLSRFLRDYLYIPLGGNRKGKARRYINLMATMLLGGLWHGAGWTFVLWGALHGVYLSINHWWRWLFPGTTDHWMVSRLYAFAAMLLTFILVVIGWVVFRSTNIVQAKIILEAMLAIKYQPVSLHTVMHGHLIPIDGLSGNNLFRNLILALLWIWFLPNSHHIKFIRHNYFTTFLQVIIVTLVLIRVIDEFGSYSPFLYFQF